MVITHQPGAPTAPGAAVAWMPPMEPVSGVPQGLEYLTLVDQIVVHQLYEFLELATGFETKNKYSLQNGNGEQVYYAFEESGCCTRQCCASQRGFRMHIVDNFNREVMLIERPFKCFGGCNICACIGCCAHECTIQAPPGHVIGYVKQRFACCSSAFTVEDADNNELFTIDGVCCCLMIGCQDKDFPVMSSCAEVGMISKKWGGCCREAFTEADIFKVSFQRDLNAKQKAILIGATFLIDFMEFEKPIQNGNGSAS